jgi:hypothetical protein
LFFIFDNTGDGRPNLDVAVVLCGVEGVTCLAVVVREEGRMDVALGDGAVDVCGVLGGGCLLLVLSLTNRYDMSNPANMRNL